MLPKLFFALLLLAPWQWPGCGGFHLFNKHKYHSAPSVRASSPPAPVPSPSLPDLPPAQCPGMDFVELVAAECGAQPRHRWSLFRQRPAMPAEECERDVTTRELQRNVVLAKDVQCVAQILIQTRSVSGIEAGLRIDPHFNFRPNCDARDDDPDVVALKGIALGILEGVWEDSQLVAKIVDGVVPSLTPTGENENWAETDENRMREHSVDRDAFFNKLNNLDYLLKTFLEDPNSSTPCLEASSPAPNLQPSSNRRRVLDEPVVGSSRRQLDESFFGSSARRLQCSDCDNADSFPCAYCWQPDVCADMYWCQGR